MFRTSTHCSLLFVLIVTTGMGVLAAADENVVIDDNSTATAFAEIDDDKVRQAVLKKMQVAGTTPDTIHDMISTLYKHRLELEIDRVGVRTRMSAIEKAIIQQKKAGSKALEARIRVKETEIQEALNLLQRRKIELEQAKQLVERGAVTVSEVEIAKANCQNAETLVHKKKLELESVAATSIQHLNELLVRTSIDNAEIEARFAFVDQRLKSLQRLAQEFDDLTPFGIEN